MEAGARPEGSGHPEGTRQGSDASDSGERRALQERTRPGTRAAPGAAGIDRRQRERAEPAEIVPRGALDATAARASSEDVGKKSGARKNSGISSKAALFPVARALTKVRALTRTLQVPVVTLAAEVSGDPFEVLVACLLSLRTKDATTAVAVKKLFARARTPQALLAIPEGELAQLIYPVGFYKTKAKVLHAVARAIVEEHDGAVPRTLEGLLALDGVGRKTANLVLTQAYGEPGICVDTHVHRIMNRWGYVATRSPDETEMALREKLPRSWWIDVNPVLVAFGQGVCGPISPLCSRCPIEAMCPKKGVTHRR